MVSVAVGAHSAEVFRVVAIWRALPPILHRPGPVREVFSSAGGGCKAGILLTLAGFRLYNRAEDFNFREEENLHYVRVDGRALTAGRGLLVDTLEHGA